MGHGVRTVQRGAARRSSISSSFTSSRSTSMHACHEVQALSSIDLSKVHIDMSSSHISENLARTRDPSTARRRAPPAQRLPPAVERARQHLAAQPFPTRHHAARRQVTDRTSSGFEDSCDLGGWLAVEYLNMFSLARKNFSRGRTPPPPLGCLFLSFFYLAGFQLFAGYGMVLSRNP